MNPSNMSRKNPKNKKELACKIILFIRQHAFLPENDNLKQVMKMIDEYRKVATDIGEKR